MPQSPSDYPKVLFVNDYPPDSLTLSNTARQLLSGYPAERLSTWHCRWARFRGLSEIQTGKMHCFRMPNRLEPSVRMTSLKSAILEWLWVPLAARHLKRVIAKEQPDVIWVLLFGWTILVARDALRKKQARLHVSIWDYPDTEPFKKVLGVARCQRLLEATYQLVRQSDSCDGISRAVAEEIASVTGRKDALVLHSGFEPKDLAAMEASPPAAMGDVIRLAYVGTIISEKSFVEMLSALKAVREKLPKKVVLEFFGVRGYASAPWFDSSWMLEHKMFSDQGLIEALRRCAWGIVVMDLDAEDIRYSRFSFPGKFGIYLSAGVPILGFGHPKSSLNEMMLSYKVGVCTDVKDRAGLEKFWLESLKIPEPQSFFRDAILPCARTEFNMEEMRNRLWKTWGVRL